MPKRKYLNPEYDPYFYRGKKLTKTQKAWNKEVEKALNRADSWVRKFHAIADVPKKPKEYGKIVTQKAIKAIKNFTWPKIGKQAQESFRKEYEQRYEEGQEGIYFPKPQYTPPTESDWLKVPLPEPAPTEMSDEYEELDEDGYTYTVDSEAELRQWIANVIESVVVSTSPWGAPNEIYGERAKIIQLVESAFNNAKNKFGEDIKFLRYLEENSDAFNELTLKAIHGYESGGQIHYIEQGGEQSMGQILTLLNFGAPISQLAEEDMRNGDFSNVFWGTGEDFYQ